MARQRRIDEEQDRQRLLELAQRLVGGRPEELAVLVVRGALEIIQPAPPVVQPGQVPEGMSAYDTAILSASTDRPVSSQRLARAAGHRHNSYFRSRLAALVETGHIHHSRRGYRLANAR
jgi:hypothetical protein